MNQLICSTDILRRTDKSSYDMSSQKAFYLICIEGRREGVAIWEEGGGFFHELKEKLKSSKSF